MQSANHLLESELSRSIISAFYAVYNYFGFGLAESVYSGGLEYELTRRGHIVERELLVQVRYHDRVVAWQRLDMVVDGQVVVENKLSSECRHTRRVSCSITCERRGTKSGSYCTSGPSRRSGGSWTFRNVMRRPALAQIDEHQTG